jgi:uncharacterized protein YhbP (UPF0306 family)
MADSRQLLEEYVREGKLMQLATRDDRGPWLCNVWYAPRFDPDRLYFISNRTRNHSAHIRADGAVAGGIMHEQLEQLGQKVRGVTFRGRATELRTEGIDEQLELFLGRWPSANGAIGKESLAREETPMRLYEVAIEKWVLFDEVNFEGDPRQEVRVR